MPAADRLGSSPPSANDVSPVGPRWRRILQRATLAFDTDRRLLCVVLGFSLVVRFASLRPLNNPDAVYKWAAARALLHGAPLEAKEFDHHAARWGVNLPTALVQLGLGESAWVYYVPILAVTTLLAWFTFRVGCHLGGRWVGALAVVVYTPLPPLSYVGSQLMPELFLSAYAMAALWALLQWSEVCDWRYFWISVAAFFGAYLAKETAVFFLPGLLAASWLSRRRLRDVVAYGAGFAGFVALETLLYRLAYGFDWGRLSVVARHHLGNPKMRPPIRSIEELLVRYLELNAGFHELFYAGLIGGGVLLSSLRAIGTRRTAVLALLAVSGSFFLCNTFALKSLDPPRLAQPLNERYLYTGMPFLALTVVMAAQVLATRTRIAWQRLDIGAVFFERARPFAPGIFAVACTAWGIALWQARSRDREHPMTVMEREQDALQAAFEAGVPIVNRDHKRHATGAVVDFFLTFEQGERARVGYPRLEGKGKGKRRGRQVRVVVDSGHARYAGLGKKRLTEKLKHWEREPFLEVSMLRGFSVAQGTSRARNDRKANR